MKTIKIKLFLLFTAFMVALVACGIVLNALFLEPYYIYKNKDIFIEKSREISEEYIGNKRSISDLLSRIDHTDGISCAIADRNMVIKYNSYPQKSGPDAAKIPNEIEQLILKNKSTLSRSYVYSVVEETSDQAPKLVLISQMSTGDIIILTKPLKGINESVSIANQFYLFAGMIIIFLGGILVFTFSKKISKPIIEMSNVAESISGLDFKRRVVYNSEDEIGNLGRSINKMSEKLNTSIGALNQDVERRKQLVRNISHELKTPIGVIKGYAEGLKYGVAEDKDKMQKYCSIIAEECDTMDSMIRELLNLSMLESGMFEVNKAFFDIGELIQKVSGRFDKILIDREIMLELDIPKSLSVCADIELIERAVTNFFINAINHAEGKKLIKVIAKREGKMVRVSIFNTGKCIPGGELKNIWDVFYKVDKARSRQYGGHGLGLPIVKLITELHGGIAGVENADEGVLFFIEIP